MTVYLDRWNGSGWDAVDIDANAISDFRLKPQYAGPTTLTFSAMQPQQTTNVGGLLNADFIRLRHSTYDGGNGLGVDPVFEGRVSIEPGTDSIGVKFTAIDPTGWSNFPLMAFGWHTVSGNIVPKTGGRPRVVWNCKQDADDDYTWARSYNSTVADIITQMFADQADPLVNEFAALPSVTPYVGSDFSGATLIPQDKLVFDTQNLRPALTTLLQQTYPNARLIWTPGTRLWRIVDLKTAPQVTLTLNDPTASDLVLSFEPHVAVDDRYTAVEIYGPPAVQQWDEFHTHPTRYTTLTANVTAGATTLTVANGSVFPGIPPETEFTIIVDGDILVVTAISGNTLTVLPVPHNYNSGDVVYLTAELLLSRGDLTDISGTDVILETWGAGVNVYAPHRWQITNPSFRQILRLLRDAYPCPAAATTFGDPTIGYTTVERFFQNCVCPALKVKYPANNMGDGKWQGVNGWDYDASTGIIYGGPGIYLYRYNPLPPLVGGINGPHCEVPVDIQFVFCSPLNPLKVRYPSTGFAGTAFTLYNIQKTYRVHDEMLALDYERNPLLTSPDRLSQFTTLAQQIHAKLSDVVFAGVALLSGLQWNYLNLDKRVNIAAIDADGATLTTGWEAANAYLTEVEFNLSDNTTTLVLNNSQLELMGLDVAKMKQALWIRKLIPIYQQLPFTSYNANGNMVSGTQTKLVGYADAQTVELQQQQFQLQHPGPPVAAIVGGELEQGVEGGAV